jgi:16S rRNA (guanine527-N7)-methyltransferase
MGSAEGDSVKMRELLLAGADELGVKLSPHQADAFFRYLGELGKWNKKINLTAITNERESIIKHVLDSLSYVHGFLPRPGLRLLDMGSGAGFPAIPLKIAFPEIEVTLVESVKKKASFLRHIVRTLGLVNVEVSDLRIEALPEAFHGAFDVVTARAFADMTIAINAGMPLLREGGRIILSRGPEEGISEQDRDRLNVLIEQREELTLPFSSYKRTLWVFKRSH